MKVLSAKVEKQYQREAWDVRLETDRGPRYCKPTFNSKGAAQAYADAVVSGTRKPEIFYAF